MAFRRLLALVFDCCNSFFRLSALVGCAIINHMALRRFIPVYPYPRYNQSIVAYTITSTCRRRLTNRGNLHPDAYKIHFFFLALHAVALSGRCSLAFEPFDLQDARRTVSQMNPPIPVLKLQGTARPHAGQTWHHCTLYCVSNHIVRACKQIRVLVYRERKKAGV